MKAFFLFVFVIPVLSVMAQHGNIPTTEKFSVEGKVKKEISFSLNDLRGYQSHTADSIIITNHLGERRNTLTKVTGVLLKDILANIIIDSESSRLLSEYYLVCIASDKYTAVFSWNEIFNNPAGNSVYIITGENGIPAFASDNRIALVSTSDQLTGRRYIKGLQKIVVERAK